MNAFRIAQRLDINPSTSCACSYGRLGFVIYRSDALQLDPVGEWRFRSIARDHRKYIVELTTGRITDMLLKFSKHGNPTLFDDVLRELLNKYELDYINEPNPSTKSRSEPADRTPFSRNEIYFVDGRQSAGG